MLSFSSSSPFCPIVTFFLRFIFIFIFFFFFFILFSCHSSFSPKFLPIILHFSQSRLSRPIRNPTVYHITPVSVPNVRCSTLLSP
ncbi:hypothetical protein P175DRAFT_068107 [Aspergillus ochraceoroseus IBT 24754]|uniref:Uncharacterized protein n=1 Tax=Aspergillus ochraceoroseus IBT 24754 TaxID=1392256 RepID=A0A2T5M9N3_9EURO|nr:uncharacterized protein P175DRAFT_068107 [Aspergillus ochraceoroseus IBT 24754]PTU25240.1 hypothetical protein P175DRAFT_068107 [Aspergillus ochraceoroseus IBT 24754]